MHNFDETVIKTFSFPVVSTRAGKMHQNKILALAVLSVLLIAPLLASASAYTVPTFTLSGTEYLQYTLPQGTVFNGTVATTGSVRVWVSDPNLTQVVNLGIIDKTTSFSFAAQQNGTYTVYFENDMPNSVQIDFSFTTDPQIQFNTGTPEWLSTVYLIVTVVVAVLGSVAIILFLRRKGKA